jgi:catechol 2,3-dioxygenase-like lactoylglutathione lyase family enzyme
MRRLAREWRASYYLVVTSIGIRHIHLLVADRERALDFYRAAFGMERKFEDGPVAFIGTPGGGDSLALHVATTDDERARVGTQGGIEHFGIHLADRSAAGVDDVLRRVHSSGGRLLDRGTHASGAEFAYVADLDGYIIEL